MNKKDKNDNMFKKYTRDEYDDAYKRRKFKEAYFGDKKIKQDYYTGKIIHSNFESAKSKYGKDAYTNHSADVDHIIPAKSVYDELKKNPFLSNKDIKEIANNKKNYRITTSKYNRQKRDKSNLDVVFDGSIDLDVNGKIKVATDYVKANGSIKLNTGIKSTKNIAEQFSDGAQDKLQSSSFNLVSKGANDLVLVACGEKDFEEAAKEMLLYSSKEAVIGGVKSVYKYSAGNMKSRIISKSNSHVLEAASKTLKGVNDLLKKLTESNEILMLIEAGKIVAGSFIKYINGEIDGKEFFEEIGQRGVELIASTAGALIGQAIIPIPVVGAVIGSMIASFASGEIFKYAKTLSDHEKNAEDVERLAATALLEMKKQRQILKDIIRDELKIFDESVNKGFDQIYSAMISDSMEEFAEGLDTILSVVNEEVEFKTQQEFNEFFDNEDSILNL